MPDIDEFSKAIGSFESSIETLFRKQDELRKEVKLLNLDVQNKITDLTKSLQKRKLWDTVKILAGACIGGFGAVAAKFAIWGK